MLDKFLKAIGLRDSMPARTISAQRVAELTIMLQRDRASSIPKSHG